VDRQEGKDRESPAGSLAWDPADEASLKPIYFHRDGPSEGQIVPRFPLVISGWAVDPEQPLLGILVTVDGTIWRETRPVHRPDVAEAMPNLPGAEASGWRAQLDLTDWPEDTVLISVVVLRRNRSWGLADQVTVRLHR
jgi:hypothetical protein